MDDLIEWSLFWWWTGDRRLGLGTWLAILAILLATLLVLTWPGPSIPLVLSWSDPASIPERIQVGDRTVFPPPATDGRQAGAIPADGHSLDLGPVAQGDLIAVVQGGRTTTHRMDGWHLASVAIVRDGAVIRFRQRHW